MNVFKKIGDIQIEFADEQMSVWDWIVAITYLAVCFAFAILHTEVAVWVWLFVTLREMFYKQAAHKSIGKPLGKRNDRQV